MRKRGSNQLVKARALDNQSKAWDLSVRGYSMHQIADELLCSTKTVGRYIAREAERRATFPSDLSSEETTKTRQVQSELLLGGMAKLIRQMDAVEADPKTSPADKTFAIAAGLRALSGANKRLAAMNGLDVPLRIQEESLRIQLTKVDGHIKVEFDRSALRPTGEPVGLYDCDGVPYERQIGINEGQE
jgi:hypothetical protein